MKFTFFLTYDMILWIPVGAGLFVALCLLVLNRMAER